MRWISRLFWAVAILATVAAILYAVGIFDRSDGAAFPKVSHIPFRTVEVPSPAEKLSEPLRDLEGDDWHIVLLDLHESVDIQEWIKTLETFNFTSVHERRRFTSLAFKRFADDRQSQVTPLLDTLKSEGLLARYDQFSIVNRIAARVKPAALPRLAEHPQIYQILEERGNHPIDWKPMLSSSEPSERLVDYLDQEPGESWGFQAINVEYAWERGYDGTGAVVGILDSGVRGDHEQLRDNFRGGENSWYDPRGALETPRDTGGHGTTVLSAAVGQNKRGHLIGVAPGAEWVAAATWRDGQFNNVFLTATADWMLHTAQPDVVIVAWSFVNMPYAPRIDEIFSAFRTADILVVVAAGNEGPTPSRVYRPASIPFLLPHYVEMLTVGGTEKGETLYEFSSRGPNPEDGGLFPMITAPARGVWVASPLTSNAVILDEGTSIATGIVAGAAAILRGADPEIHVHEMEAYLRGTARDLGVLGPDNLFGHGQLDIEKLIWSMEDIERARRAREALKQD